MLVNFFCNHTSYKSISYLCNNSLPKYEIETIIPQPGKGGSFITIEGYMIDNPEKHFNYETIKDYIVCFTAAGSFKTYFANYTELHKYINSMQITPRIFIEDRINDIKDEIAGTHQFHPPVENPKIDPCEPIYKRSINYCRHFRLIIEQQILMENMFHSKCMVQFQAQIAEEKL